MEIPFVDLKKQYLSIKEEIDQKIHKILMEGNFILGKEVELFEKEFANYCGAKYCVGVGSGTDALFLSLKVLNVGLDDEVITPTLSFIATTLAITEVGANPVFIDSNPDTFQVNINEIEEKITQKTKVILPVHLYGAPCEIEKIVNIAKKYKLKVVEDACQAHGAKMNDKKIGTFGNIGVFSFYPSKNLGAYGDGGAIVTNDQKLYKKLSILRNYGQKVKYYHDKIGVNSRLDEIQAAVLNVKLKYLNRWNIKRNQIAQKYRSDIKNFKFQKVIKNGLSCYYVFAVESEKRGKLIEYLKKNGVQTLIHYPIPIHLQKCYKYLGFKKGDFPNAEKITEQIVSLPIYSEMSDIETQKVVDLLNNFNRMKNN